MTAEQWGEIVDWIADRFPDSQWHAEQAVAYFHDLKQFDVADVWVGLFAVYEKGIGFAPNGSVIALETRSRMRAAARPEHRSLPADTNVERLTWATWSEKKYGEQLTGQQVMERIWNENQPTGGTT